MADNAIEVLLQPEKGLAVTGRLFNLVGETAGEDNADDLNQSDTNASNTNIHSICFDVSLHLFVAAHREIIT